MKYVAIDLETSGLDPQQHQILELAVVVEDTEELAPVDELPFFRCVVGHQEIVGSPGALEMNSAVLKRINEEGDDFVYPEMLFNELYRFLGKHYFEYDGERFGRVIFAGKNAAGFDVPFLKNHEGFDQFQMKIDSRVLDPAVLFVDWDEDLYPPGLSACKERAGLESGVAHRALADARDVVKLLRHGTGNYERRFFS